MENLRQMKLAMMVEKEDAIVSVQEPMICTHVVEDRVQVPQFANHHLIS